MPTPSPTLRAAAMLVAGLAAVGTTVAASVGATASPVNRRPICNEIGFNVPLTIGASVSIPVTDVAADPDLTPVTLVSVFGGAPVGSAVISNNGTPAVPGDDVLVFTRTDATRTSVYLYWTVSDGALSAQCLAVAYDRPPGDG